MKSIEIDFRVVIGMFLAGFILAIVSNHVFGPDGHISPEIFKHVQSVVSPVNDPYGKSNY
mgnify:CR=1 FL=1